VSALRRGPAPASRPSPLQRFSNFLIASIGKPSLEARLHGGEPARPVGAMQFASEQPIDGLSYDVRDSAVTVYSKQAQCGLLVVVEVYLSPGHW
jgi:hypothetical protein